jgi:hypothetical protein
MKKIFWLVIIVFAAGGLFWFAKERKTTEPAQENQGNNEVKTGGNTEAILFSTTTISQSDNFYNIKAEYPQFSFAGRAFNEKISSLISEKIETFKKDAKDYWDARKATALEGEVIPENPDSPFDFVAEWKPTKVDGKFISFYLNIYYFSGGAHGISEILGFNYDIAQQREITMSDFLGGSQKSLDVLSLLAKEDIVSRFQAQGMDTSGFMGQMIDEGTAATYDNYEDFNFNDNSLIIYFQQYQVAPGSAGQVTVTLSKNVLEQNLIMSNYLQ